MRADEIIRTLELPLHRALGDSPPTQKGCRLLVMADASHWNFGLSVRFPLERRE